MLQEVYLINSARFRLARVDLRRDLFFLGDNGSGKTSFIRAIHFLYSGDTRSVGIPADKTSFADYYFPFENSYIVYGFSNFFILMVRRSGEIAKYFSLQPFSLPFIMDDKGELLPFEAIRRTIRRVFHKRVAGVREYTEILYGQNRKYLDFALTRIGNHGPFLRLYNAIFNIDRAMIDAKSLKQALFTALELDRQSAYFDPDEYLRTVNEFAQYSRLFHDFERERKRIERLVALKPELLEAEEGLHRLSRQINYREKEERRLLEEANAHQAKLAVRLEAMRKRQAFFERVDARIRRRCDAAESEVRFALEEIRKLKALYTPERLAAWRKRAGERHEIAAQKREAEREYAVLSAGVIDQVESVARQIASLERERDEGLALRFARRLEEERGRLREELAEALAGLEAAWEGREARFEERMESLERRMEEERGRLEAIDAELAGLGEQKAALTEETAKAKEKAARSRDRAVEAATRRRLALTEEREALVRKRRDETDRYRQRRQKAEADYRRECETLEDERKRLEGAVRSEPGTFRAFLDDEVEGWRRKLYPVMEKSLLTMPVESLSPRYLGEPLLGIEIDTASLPSMPTVEEAQRALAELAARSRALEESFEAARERLAAEEADALARIDGETAVVAKRIAREEAALRQAREACETALAQIAKEEETARKRLADEGAELSRRRREIEEKIAALRDEKEALKKRRKSEKSTWRKRREAQKSAYETALKRLRKRLEAERAEEAARLEAQIAQLGERKARIEADERLHHLASRIAALEEALQEALAAQTQLEAYRSDRQKLEAEPELLARKARIETTRRRLAARRRERYGRLREAKEMLEGEIVGAKARIARIEKGLAQEAPEPVDADEEPTREYLIDLKPRYKEATMDYRERLLELQELMRRVNAIEGLHRLDQLHFDLGLFEQARFLGEIDPLLAAIDRLDEVLKSSLDTVKRGQQLKFRNFVENLYTKKLELFSSGEARFAELVRQINRELKRVDFGVIREIRIETRIGSGESVAAMLEKLREKMADVGSLFTKDSLFFDRRDALKHLEEMEALFARIKKALGGDRISLVDTVDLGLSFTENGTRYENRSRIKNESSTGGSMLLKIALAVSILRVYLKEAKGGFFLIVDEVARLHSGNQRRLKAFANASGFRIIFVTPEPVFADPEALGYYKFQKREEGGFEVIALNR